MAESELPSGTKPGHVANFHSKMNKALKKETNPYLVRKYFEHNH